MGSEIIFSKELYQRATQKLMARRLASLEGNSIAVLATADGRLCVATDDDEEKSSRQAALSSALLSLSQRFCQEVLASSNGEIALSSETGNVVIVRLEFHGQPYQLCLASDHSDNLATILRAARDMSSNITQLSV